MRVCRYLCSDTVVSADVYECLLSHYCFAHQKEYHRKGWNFQSIDHQKPEVGLGPGGDKPSLDCRVLLWLSTMDAGEGRSSRTLPVTHHRKTTQ
eukprot:1918241-Rhodomonas_salina.4